MGALLYPVHPTTKGTRWGLVAHAAAMFSFLTIGCAINRDILSTSYIDDREFPDAEGRFFDGPFGYLNFFLWDKQGINYVSYFMFPFNQWLADGFLVSSASNSAALAGVSRSSLLQLYRTFVIYSMSYWAIALPFLLYLASIGTCLNLP